MLGRPEWFNRRKYSGWGITPKTWQGWAYIAAMVIPFVILQALPFWSNTMRAVFTGVWLLIVLVDVFDIMIRMKKDERERIHEAIAERNAMWFIMMTLVLAVLYDVVKNAGSEKIYIHPFIIIALVGGVLVKAATNLYLEKKR